MLAQKHLKLLYTFNFATYLHILKIGHFVTLLGMCARLHTMLVECVDCSTTTRCKATPDTLAWPEQAHFYVHRWNGVSGHESTCSIQTCYTPRRERLLINPCALFIIDVMLNLY